MSNITGDGGNSSGNNTGEEEVQHHVVHGQASATTTSNDSTSHKPPSPVKKKRNLPGTPDPNAEVIALSPTTLMATNRFVCEICNKGFQRDQNLQLHRRGHNLPWKLKQRTTTEIRRRVYICPESTCVHHNPSRALGDLTGIKKHFCRKHGEKKWKCDKCSKKYAVQSDWKAHSKTCGTREYRCNCGTIFSRRDSFITHRAFCDALTEENKAGQALMTTMAGASLPEADLMMPIPGAGAAAANPFLSISDFSHDIKNLMPMPLKSLGMAGSASMFSSTSGMLFGPHGSVPSASSSLQLTASNAMCFEGLSGDGKFGRVMPATALLQKAAQIGATASSGSIGLPMMHRGIISRMAGHDQISGVRAYNTMQAHVPYEQLHLQENQNRSQLMEIDGGVFASQSFDALMAKGSTMTDMGMLSAAAAGLYVEHERSSSVPTNILQGRIGVGGEGRMAAAGLGSGGGSGDVITLNLLGGEGGISRRGMSFHEQQQVMEHEGVRHQRVQQVLQQYQQQMAHGRTSMESIWDV